MASAGPGNYGTLKTGTPWKVGIRIPTETERR